MDSANNFYIAGPQQGLSTITPTRGSDGVIMKMNSDGEFISGGSGGFSSNNVNSSKNKKIELGGGHSCYLDAEGMQNGWETIVGQLGDGTNQNRSVPAVSLKIKDILLVNTTACSQIDP